MRLSSALIMVSLFSLFGCVSSEEREYNRLVQELNRMTAIPTPEIWINNKIWSFILINNELMIEQSYIFEFTNDEANSCTDAPWKSLNILSQNPNGGENSIGNPAYNIEGSYLSIDLTADICDSGNNISGELNSNGFNGTHGISHLFGGELRGKAYGVPNGT